MGLGPACLLLDKDHNRSRVAWKGGWGRRAEVREPPFPVTSPGFLEAQVSGTANSGANPDCSSALRDGGALLPLGSNRKFF